MTADSAESMGYGTVPGPLGHKGYAVPQSHYMLPPVCVVEGVVAVRHNMEWRVACFVFCDFQDKLKFFAGDILCT